MTEFMLVAAGLLTLAGLAGTIASLVRRWPPSMDRPTGRRVAAALNRGRLPSAEPDRSLAVGMARSRAMNGWLAVSAAGVALLMARGALEPTALFPAGLWWAVTALAVLGAALNAVVAIQAARALRSA